MFIKKKKNRDEDLWAKTRFLERSLESVGKKSQQNSALLCKGLKLPHLEPVVQGVKG